MPWAPGQSGNPGGRPKTAGLIRDLARQHGPEAIEKLVDHLRGDDPDLAHRAALALLDRGYGRPTAALAADDDDDPAGPKGVRVFVNVDLGGGDDADR